MEKAKREKDEGEKKKRRIFGERKDKINGIETRQERKLGTGKAGMF